MNRTSARPALAALSAALLLLPVAGCGGDDESPASSSVSSSPTTAETSAPATVDEGAFVDRVLAAIDAKTSVHLEISGGSFLTASADMAYGGAEPDSRIEASVYGGTQVVVIKSGVVYLQASPGAPFSVVDEQTPVLGPLIKTFTALGPRESVAGIDEAIVSVEEVGPKTIEGRDLTAYDVTVDTAELTGALKLLAGTSGASDELAMTFFLDDDGLVHQIDFPITGEPVSITFTDWDKPVTIEKPTNLS